MTRPPPRSPLFPYTTLFRSLGSMPDAAIEQVSFHNGRPLRFTREDRKSTRLNSSHRCISYAVFCLKKKNNVQASIMCPATHANELARGDEHQGSVMAHKGKG